MSASRPGEGQVLTLSCSGRQVPEGSVDVCCASQTSQRDRPIGHRFIWLHVYICMHMYTNTC